MFDIIKFNAEFDVALASLQKAEKITKATLSELSRLLLEQQHFNGDIQPCNRLLSVLTPVNCKTAVLFFMHFSGHVYSEKEGVFKGRDKAHFEAKQKNALAFLEDPHNNIWTWAEREVKIEAKPFTLDKVTKFMENALKKAEKEGISQTDVIKAILKAGIEPEAFVEILGELDFVAEAE